MNQDNRQDPIKMGLKLESEVFELAQKDQAEAVSHALQAISQAPSLFIYSPLPYGVLFMGEAMKPSEWPYIDKHIAFAVANAARTGNLQPLIQEWESKAPHAFVYSALWQALLPELEVQAGNSDSNSFVEVCAASAERRQNFSIKAAERIVPGEVLSFRHIDPDRLEVRTEGLKLSLKGTVVMGTPFGWTIDAEIDAAIDIGVKTGFPYELIEVYRALHPEN
jgi:hypothetical protein